MDIIQATTTEEFVRLSAEWISSAIHQAANDGKNPVVGLCGGSTPEPVYTMLATDQSVPWERVHFFLLDERYVPTTDKDSNQAMVRRTLLTRAAANARFLAPDTSLPLRECIQSYTAALDSLTPDLVIVGMGTDGHITSLFPPVPPEAFGPATVIHTTTDRFAVRDRISVTFPILERAKKRVVLITGAEKKALLEKIRYDTVDASMMPAQALIDERTTWMVGP